MIQRPKYPSLSWFSCLEIHLQFCFSPARKSIFCLVISDLWLVSNIQNIVISASLIKCIRSTTLSVLAVHFPIPFALFVVGVWERSFRNFWRYFEKRVILESKSLSDLDFSFILLNKASPQSHLKYIFFLRFCAFLAPHLLLSSADLSYFY